MRPTCLVLLSCIFIKDFPWFFSLKVTDCTPQHSIMKGFQAVSQSLATGCSFLEHNFISQMHFSIEIGGQVRLDKPILYLKLLTNLN